MTSCARRVILASIPLFLTTLASVARAQTSHSFIPRQVIIKLDPADREEDVRAVQNSLGATVKQHFQNIGAELWEISGIAVPDAVDRFRNDPRVVYIEPNFVVHADDVFPNDPRFGELWGLHNTGQSGGKADADIDAPEAWSIGTGGSVLVGIIDTGVDWHHIDLGGNIFANPGEIPGNGIDDDANGFVDDVRGWDFVNNDNDPMDDNGHGTHVSGTIAGIGNNGIGVAGVSWSARILPIKFLDSGGSGSTAAAILAVQYATKMGVRLTSNSWGGGGFSAALRDAIADAGNHGILFVAAAGNDGVNNDFSPHYPSSYDLDNIISVASTDRFDFLSGFSNYGVASVDIGAPGSDILSTFPGNSYATLSGTSMATPHVSGAVCLVWAAAPLMTHSEVKAALLATVDPISALSGKVVSNGRLNINGLLSSLDKVAPARVGDLAVASTGSTSARLTWTATGDDGSTGTASVYDLRYSKSGIYWSNFNGATRATGVPHPNAVGSPESFEVTGLDFNTRYYFALVVEDERGNRSSISSLPGGTTLGAPHLQYAPGSFSAALHTGGTETKHLTLSNDAEGTLDFSTASAPTWVHLDPPTGRVLAGQSLPVDVVFDATSLPGGTYNSTVMMATNDPSQPVAALSVGLEVTDAPDIVVSPLVLDFHDHYIGTCAPDTVVVRNIGTAPLLVSGVSTTNPAFSTASGGFTLAPGATRIVAVSFCAVSVGAVEATLSFATNDPDHPIYDVVLRGEGHEPPVISVNPSSISADLFVGGVSDQTLTIANQGGSNLDFEVAIEDASTAANLDVFGSAASKDVVGVGRPLSSPELERLKASFPRHVSVGGAIDRGAPSKKHAGEAMALSRVTGSHLEEVFGSAQNEFTGSTRTRGNLFTCTTSTKLVEQRLYMNPFGTTQLWFLVYEGPTQAGSYALISASNVSPAGPGAGWYSSGDVNVNLEAGRFYLIVASFDQTSNYYNELDMTPYPIPASFGELTAGAGWDWAPSTVFPPAPFQDVPDFAFGSAAAYYQTLVTKGAVRWLSLDPESGTVGPAASMNVAVKFDAEGVFGGDYDANVRIASNDPITPEVVVPAHLHVTGAPDIAVSATVLDWGPQFIGAAVRDTLVVANHGTDLLHVNSLVTSDPAYTVDVIDLTLAPVSQQNVVVTFAPTTTGPLPATLTLTSNDPDEPAIVIQLQGAGVMPPIIAVSPASLSEDLFTGETATHTLSISNSGESNLTFGIAVASAPSSVASLLSRNTGAGATSRDITPAGATGRSPRGPAYAANRTGSGNAQVENWPHLNASISGLSVLLLRAGETAQIRAILQSFPDIAAVDEFDGGSDTPSLATLANYDAVILINNYSFADPVGVGNVLADYADQGGGVIMTVASFVSGWSVQGRFLSGGYYPFTLGSGPTGSSTLGNYDPGHPIMAGVTSAFGDLLAATTVASGATWVANWSNGQPLVATQGQHVAGINVFVNDGGYWSGDIPLVLHNAAVWAAGAAWLRVEPADGVVAPHANLDVAVTFNAARLFGGDYAANLSIKNNDPIHPEVVVPASLHVTGAPDITVSQTLLDYGAQFIGASIPDTLVVKNDGTDLLTVTSVVSSHPDYTVNVSSFALAPTMSRKIAVTFSPTSVGSIPATLTITSNDADEGLVQVSLQGSGVEPPIISVTPASFSENLITGQTANHTMTISNTGVSPLDFAIRTVKREATALALPLFAGGETSGKGRGVANVAAAAFGASTVRSTDAPVHVAVAAVDTTGGGGPAVLVIQDFQSWGLDMRQFVISQFGIYPTLINSYQITGTDFAPFDLIITTGAQGSDYYAAISANVAKFQAFVSSGGVVQYQAATYGDNVSLAGGAHSTYGNQEDYNDVVSPGHPIVAGLPAVLQGYYANHNYLTSLPAGAVVITETTDSAVPTTVEYKVGAGSVIATGMTWEYLYNYGYPAGAILRNAVEYSLSLAGVGWLNVQPASGTVPPGQSMDIAVEFDASGLFGGDYAANIRVDNNDPIHPEVAIPADMHVTGAPDITVSQTLLDYGVHFIGTSTPDTLVVRNDGTDLLTVTSVASNDVDYTVDVSSFTLAPTRSQKIVVTFSPASVGSNPATLTITSNDADEGLVQVSLQGSGVEPPVIAVTPASFSESLLTGQTANRTMTISNTGASPLQFVIRREKRDTTALQVIAGDRASGKAGGAAYVAAAVPLLAGARDLASARMSSAARAVAPATGAGTILSTDSRSQTGTRVAASEGVAGATPAILVIQDQWWGVTMTQFILDQFGIPATGIYSYQIPSTDFAPYDLIITTGGQYYEYYNAISTNVAKFQSFAAAGGVVQYMAATYGETVVLAGGAHSTYGFQEFTNDVVSPSHPIVAGLPAVLQGAYANNNYLTDLPAGTVVITKTTSSDWPTTVEYKIGSGTVIATGMTWELMYYYGYPVGALLRNAVAYSLELAGVNWLNALPGSGTVPAGQSMDVTVVFDAGGLFGGDYAANLRILSNDPVHAEVAIPADLHVTGAPDISVNPGSLFYVPVFVGNSASQVVTVTNAGTDSLVVSSISSSLPDYTVNATHFTLAPSQARNVTVTFAPTSEGVIDGVLTIASNDPDEPSSTVTLQGTGAESHPDITATPAFVFFGSVPIGGTAQQTVTVANDGTGYLVVSDVSSDHADFTNDVTHFTVFQATSKNVVVSFKPSTAGFIIGHLNITSNDPDEGIVSLYLFGTGTLPPVIGVDPSSVADTLATGQSATHTIHVSNTGAGDLVLNAIAVETPVGSAQDGDPSAEGGGPDLSGYRWHDSNDPGGPVFAWIDAISGSNVGLQNDGFVTGIPLGFTFRYYENDYTTIGVGANGWLSFNGSGNGFPVQVPSNDAYAGAIAPFARDLNSSLALYVRFLTRGTAPNRQFVVEYHGVPVVGGGAATFEVILTEGTNVIRFQYQATSSAPLGFGIESPDQTQGMGNGGTDDLHISPALVEDSYAIEFSPVPLWLSVAPPTATVPPGGSLDLVVTMNAGSLSSGQYAGRVSLRSNDPVNPVVPVSISLFVVNTTTTGVDPNGAPTAYALLPNHPNPFNPITTIAYDLPKAGMVHLVVYDVSGRVVNQLVRQNQPAGHYDLVWDGRNASGAVVASGVYFYRLVAGSFVHTRKMVMLK